ncbi:MAG: 30S ribosomal protein S8 [Bdellovibrionota bacterium]|jgi:small subunit ribosomal protein S8
MLTDPIADCLSRVRNASQAGHSEVKMMYSRMKESVLQILRQEGLVASVDTVQEKSKKYLIVQLRYSEDLKPMIHRLKRLSRPGQRVYKKTPTRLEARSGLGFQILSTSKGLMTDRQAMEKKLGGELVAEVW